MDPEEYVERVLAVVERIPPGRVMSYGAIAEVVGLGGPRQVGRVMSLHSGGTPWWRVVRADGGLPDCHGEEALRHHRSEGTPLRASDRGHRVDMASAAWWPTDDEVPATGPGSVGRL